MADDPYTVLGVPRDATEKQIRAAFHKVAKTSHPDLNPGDKKAEERFKSAANAHDLLSDADKRARFDRGEIDATGNEAPPRPRYRDFADSTAGARYGRAGAGTFTDDELGDILSGLFRDGSRPGTNPGQPRRGQDQRYTLTVGFIDAARGGPQRLDLPTGGIIDVQVPPGTESGVTLRLRGKGNPGTPPGDALIDITVEPHPVFRRDGRDIHLDLPVTVAEAVLGGRVTVPTIAGPVTMSIPACSDAGARLRLRGRGIPAHGAQPAGDAFATLRIVIGPVDDTLRVFLQDWAPQHGFDPREALEAQA